MKTINFIKSNSDKCRRMIVIAEINKLHNLSQNQLRNGKIAREVGKLHSLWFKSTSKEVRLSGLRDNW